MHYGNIMSTIGKFWLIVAGAMLLPFGAALYYGEPAFPYIFSAVLTAVCGLVSLKYFRTSADQWTIRESYAIVALGWFSAAVFSAIPFLYYNLNIIDSFFEAMSGITTTGGTILMDFDAYPKSFHFWRAVLHWLGGLGIVALFLAVLPKINFRAQQLFNAEVKKSPDGEKISPKMSMTAKILWAFYLCLTAAAFIVLYLLGMSPFDALVHAFSVIGSGGFSDYGDSIAHFGSPAIEAALIFFMMLAGTNFGLLYRTISKKNISVLLKDEEFVAYITSFLFISALLTFVLWKENGHSVLMSVHYAFFHVASLMSTTGFAAVDYELWSPAAKIILMIAAFIGGCAGSTSGGPAVVRWLIIIRHCRRDIFKNLHPTAVRPIRYNGKTVPEENVNSVVSFMILFAFLFALSTILLAILGLDIVTSLSSSIAMIGNVGPALGIAGPMGSFGMFPPLAKIILIMDMWIGRLGIYTVLALFTLEFWKE